MHQGYLSMLHNYICSTSKSCLGSGRFVGNYSPVGFIPKSFSHFHHPRHEILKDNGLKQHKYLKFYKYFLADFKYEL